MKRFLVIMVMPFLMSTAHGQVIISLLLGETLNTGKVEFGLDGGVNWNSLHGVQGAKDLRIWNLGFYFDIKLWEPAWMIHTGVIVKSTMGTKNSPLYLLGDATLDSAFAGGSVNTKLQYFNVPIMLKHKFPFNVFVEGGVMLGLLYGATDVFVKSVHDDEDLSYERGVRHAYHPLDAGLMIGVGYRLLGGDGMNLGVRYYYGLVDVYIDDSGPSRLNRALYLTVGIPIGAGEQAAP